MTLKLVLMQVNKERDTMRLVVDSDKALTAFIKERLPPTGDFPVRSDPHVVEVVDDDDIDWEK